MNPVANPPPSGDLPWPDRLETEPELDELLTRPSPALVQFISNVQSPLLVLGAGGKMGPTLCVLAQRAAAAAGHRLEVIAVSRFGRAAPRDWLEARGVRTLSCDLFDPQALAGLPESANLIYLVGYKFGTQENPSLTWAINTLLPARVCDRYPRARIVALSTGNVYPLSDVAGGGSREGDPLTPRGEYANATVGRERVFEFYSRWATTPVALLRLFYAVDLRYGVPVDIARRVQAGVPIDVANGYFNCIWQGDANDLILRALGLTGSPPSVWNLCRPEVCSVRDVAGRFGEAFGREPQWRGVEAPTALLGNSRVLCELLGEPPVSLERMIGWIAHWVRHGGRNLGRPTHFEERNGSY